MCTAMFKQSELSVKDKKKAAKKQQQPKDAKQVPKRPEGKGIRKAAQTRKEKRKEASKQ